MTLRRITKLSSLQPHPLTPRRQHRRHQAGASGRGGSGGDDALAALMAEVAPSIVSGEPLVERKSTFQAHVARVTHPRQVAAVIAVLLQNNK